MKKTIFLMMLLFLSAALPLTAFAQDEDDEDWDAYGDLELVDDSKVKRFAKPTIVGLSPTRFLSVSYDRQLPYDMNLSAAKFPASVNDGWGVDESAPISESGRVNFTGGLRFNSNIPVISKSSLVWQTGLNYMRIGYSISDVNAQPNASGLTDILDERGLNNLNWTNTFFVPISEENFFIFQGILDMSGDYGWGLQPFNTIRWSLAAVYAKRVSENKRWGLGVSRTYRVGNLNYVPVVMYDVTSADRKWGTEILFPARMHGRYNFSKNSLLLFGYELEGQSYRIDQFSVGNNSYEIRRGELRPRLEYQKQLSGPFWMNFQAGYRIDWTYNADELEGSREFFRGFFGNQRYGMVNNLSNTVYFNVGISFVTM
ncbi:DUF6268 family outer membrane beta-barrel protein [Belliella sp. DSM 111904]|uniref:DUF6268 family outer membrane beta-barrel protein n=1 Tax=Belliella filtrata TaxID=2923435 RepID=A0ABS9V115_9BACT|nr:DUF6268 family outer membrane beta-barrel protein [Belliella filtrata]MCH7410023.1 DUF6268 family outer membrane beta-barrel protein [Belliella filtrata]